MNFRLPILLFAVVLFPACGGSGSPDSAETASTPEESGRTEEAGPEDTFARGLDIHISDVVMGDPPGTILFEKDLPLRFRVMRRVGTAAEPVQVVVESQLAAGSVVNTSAEVTMPSASEGEATAVVPEPLSMILGVPGADASATVWLASTASGAEVSNRVTVPYRVVAAP